MEWYYNDNIKLQVPYLDKQNFQINTLVLHIEWKERPVLY